MGTISRFLVKYKIDFVDLKETHYSNRSGAGNLASLSQHVIFIETQLTNSVSTTDIISRIIRDYHVYVQPNHS